MTARPAPIIIGAATWRGRALVPVLAFVGILAAVVSSLGSPLIPTIATGYGVSLGSAQWSLTITLLVGAVAAPVVGRLSDGPRRLHVLLASLAVLVVGSVVAALPVKVFVLLLVGRGMQGIGLALLPVVMSVARDHLEPARARSTVATLSVTAVVGLGLGYPLTGLIAEHLDFHAAFWLAAVLGLIAIVLSALVVPTAVHRSSQHFDVPGAVLLGLGLAGLLVTVTQGQEWGWVSVRSAGLGVASLVLIAGWVWHELRIEMPLVDLRLMRNRTVLTANVTGLMAGAGMYMLMSMIIRYVQTPRSLSYGLGASVVVGGFALLPLSATSFFSSRLSTYLGRRLSPDRILPLGVLGLAVAMALFAATRSHLWEIFIEMAIAGAAIGCSFAVLPRMIVISTPANETASALALNQVIRTVGYSIGSALAATILTANTLGGAEFPENRGYTVGSVVSIVLLVLTAVASWLLPTGRSAGTAPLSVEQALSVEESADSAIAGVLAFELDVDDPDQVDTPDAREPSGRQSAGRR
jgi:predicted MFS family arabinose efflux permease